MAFIQPEQLSNTITLKPGEVFTLPPGAVIKTVIGTGLLSDCADIPAPEQMSCYATTFSIADKSGDDSTNPGTSLTIRGFRINHTDYLFDSNFAFTLDDGFNGFTSLLQAAINTNPFLKSVIFNSCGWRFADGSSNRGSQFVVAFSGADSLFNGGKAQLIASIGSVGLISGGFDHPALFPITLKSLLDAQSTTLSNVCQCEQSLQA